MRLVAAILFVAGVLLIALFVYQTSLYETLSIGWLIPAVVVLAGLFLLAAFLRYKRPRADQAMVRTGGRKYKVKFQGGGLWLFTLIHEVRPVHSTLCVWTSQGKGRRNH